MNQTRDGVSTEDSSTEDAAREGGRDGHDRATEELRSLLDALAFRAEEYLLGLGRSAEESGAPTGGERVCEPAGTCGWCPLCAAVSLLRGDRPELAVRLSEQVAGLVTLLRQALAEQRDGPSRPAGQPSGAEGSPAEAEAEPVPPKVQRIDVQRVRGSVLRPGGTGVRAEARGC